MVLHFLREQVKAAQNSEHVCSVPKNTKPPQSEIMSNFWGGGKEREMLEEGEREWRGVV